MDITPGPPPDASYPVQDRWRVYVACYLAYVLVLVAVEGAGRKACVVPIHLVESCLDATAWYSYPMTVLFIAAWIAPLYVVWILKKRIFHFAMRLPLFGIKAAAVLYLATFLFALILSLGTYFGVQWTYEVYG
jgi:hypothetical protein